MRRLIPNGKRPYTRLVPVPVAIDGGFRANTDVLAGNAGCRNSGEVLWNSMGDNTSGRVSDYGCGDIRMQGRSSAVRGRIA